MTLPWKLISRVCRVVPTPGKLAVAMGVPLQVVQSENFTNLIIDDPPAEPSG
jgi:hypothetical protein